MIELLALGHDGFLVGRGIDQPVLPFAGLAVVADRRVERGIAAEPAVHVDHVLIRHAEALGNQLHLVGVKITLVQRGDLALRLAQVEEQLLLVRGGAHLHERPRAQEVFLDRRLDPPHGVGGEPEALLRLEALDRLHQADIALGDRLRDRQAVAAIVPGDLGHEPQMAGDELVRRVAISVLMPALGEHVFFLALQHREPPDFLKIMGEAGFGRRKDRQGRVAGHDQALQLVSKQNYLHPIGCQVNFETLLYAEEAIMSARETAELLLQVGRLVQAEGYDGELGPAQWMALRFFARANSFSRTPSAFAEFQATTRGTATHAIKALEAGGYLVRQPFKTDGRSVSLRLTSKGKKALARDPFEVLVRAVDSLDATERTATRRALHQVLSTLATSG